VHRRFLLRFSLLLVLFGAEVSFADPPVIPDDDPPEVPCQPLICLQVTDARQVASATKTWRFEFEALNWTAFTDRPCGAWNPNCIDRTSPGAVATGLVFVRNALRSTVPFRVVPVDPNGAPLGLVTRTETETIGTLPSGDPGVDLSVRFLDRIDSITNLDKGGPVPDFCFDLIDSIEGVIKLKDFIPACDAAWDDGDQLELQLKVHDGDQTARVNSWSQSSCSENQVIWLRSPADPLEIDAGDPNMSSCPITCADKDSLGNVLDGFVIEVDAFGPGERIVFSWYLIGESGPIAAGGPPTPTDQGSLTPSPQDPWGFSFGSYQIDGRNDCSAGNCDTMIMVRPPVVDPTVSCLIDEQVDRNSLPFDFYISMSSSGVDPPCRLEPGIELDPFGIERLMVNAEAGTQTDTFIVQFLNVDTKVIDRTDRFPLHDATAMLATDDLVGRYEVNGVCEDSASGRFFFVDSFPLAVPRRGDLPDTGPTDLMAMELDEISGAYALTGSLPAGVLDLDNAVDAMHFVQVRDRNGDVRIFGTDGGAAHRLDRVGGALVLDTEPPSILCAPDLTLGTRSDGDGDCQVEAGVTAVALDPAGGFTVSNSLHKGEISRSFGTTVGVQEVAQLTVTDVFGPGAPVTIDFIAIDDAGQSAACSTTVTIVDDGSPDVACQLVHAPSGKGHKNGGGFYVVAFTSGDDCGVASVQASIDGVPVTLDQPVQITHASRDLTSRLAKARLHITTPHGGVLEVVATDSAGNETVCETPRLAP